MADNVDNPNPDTAAAPAVASADTSGASTETATTGTATVAGGAAADAIVVERPADLPESFWDADAKAPKFADISARLTRADELEAAETARKEGVPGEAKDYKFDPAGDPIMGPDGKPAAIDPANPLAQAVAGVAHKHGLPQAAVADFARAYIETELQAEKGLQEALAAETAKLGDKARERVDAVSSFIKQHCGDNADAAIAALGTAGAVQAWEAVSAKLSGAAITSTPGQDSKAKSLTESWFPSMKPKAA